LGRARRRTVLSGILVTTIYVIGLLIKKKPRFLGMGLDSVLVLAVYLASLHAFYSAR
jgi:cation:H+ antiporter